MSKEEIIRYIKDNLEIKLRAKIGSETITTELTIELFLEGEVISVSTINIREDWK